MRAIHVFMCPNYRAIILYVGQVFNFPEVIVAMERSDDLQDFGFFASSDSAEYIQRGREESKAFPKPRLGRMWSF